MYIYIHTYITCTHFFIYFLYRFARWMVPLMHTPLSFDHTVQLQQLFHSQSSWVLSRRTIIRNVHDFCENKGPAKGTSAMAYA